jgi:iron complex outermembrane receptor protein
MSYKNQLVLTGSLNDVGDPIRTNVDKSYRMGVEADATIKLGKQVTWNVNLTVSRNKIQDFKEVIYDFGVNWDEYNVVVIDHTDTDISFSPSVISGSVLSVHPMRNWEFSLLSKFVGKQYLDNTSDENRKISPYFVNDIRVRYTLQPEWAKELSFSMLVNNILNERYESNGYTWGYIGGGATERQNYYFPQASTNLMFMVALKF